MKQEVEQLNTSVGSSSKEDSAASWQLVVGYLSLAAMVLVYFIAKDVWC